MFQKMFLIIFLIPLYIFQTLFHALARCLRNAASNVASIRGGFYVRLKAKRETSVPGLTLSGDFTPTPDASTQARIVRIKHAYAWEMFSLSSFASKKARKQKSKITNLGMQWLAPLSAACGRREARGRQISSALHIPYPYSTSSAQQLYFD